MKKGMQTILLLVIYFILMFLPMFLGFLSPTLWIFYPVASAFLAATPVLWGAKTLKNVGGVAIFPLFWFVLMVAMGELSFPERLVTPIIIIIIAEIVRKLIGYDKQNGLRISYAITSLVTVTQHIIIFTRTDFYYAGAVEEMGSIEYADALLEYAKPIYLVLLIVLTLVSGYAGTVVSEKLFKDKVTYGMIRDAV